MTLSRTPDPLATPAGRAATAEAMARGMGAVNRLFGCRFPDPGPDALVRATADPACADPDLFHLQAAAGAFAGFDAQPRGLERLFDIWAGCIPRPHFVGAVAERAAAWFREPDAALVARARARFDIVPQGTADLASDTGVCHAKINHGYWEGLAYLGLLTHAGPDLAACLGPRRAYFDTIRTAVHHALRSGLHGAVAQAIRQFRHEDPAAGAVRFLAPGASLGVGLTNGDQVFAETLRTPLGVLERFALAGLLGHFDTLEPGTARLQLADSGSVRQLFFAGQLQALVRALAPPGQAVVFVVPTHLRQIVLAGHDGPQHVILVPHRHAHDLWPLVLAGVMARVGDLLARHGTLTCLVQASALSAPCVAAIRSVALAAGRPVQCCDMGQLLDAARLEAGGTGLFLTRDHARRAAQAQANPFALATPRA
jgi:hypothetical protein